jgi:NADPH-dependent glutamate synthase beta subunit-like oxidoreductase/glutamate synthase domain-containing protein 3/NAD-dependent dihydropyrimidine dehydrogenase PreA subunit
MDDKQYYTISGKKDGVRIDSRLLEEQIQSAVKSGHRHLTIEACGQHGIGGRLWKAESEPIRIRIEGQPGQRLGSLGFSGTTIEVVGPASDDVGWLNAGAEIIVHGNAGNGIANAMAQGKVYVAGNIGARGMTMTKHNPRFAPPELWVLGSVGDYFGEFMAGGISVVCGYDPQNPENVLGYRPFVGMVSGKVFFRGPHKGYSVTDTKQIAIEDDDWQWLINNLSKFLNIINRKNLIKILGHREDWQLLSARSPQERYTVQKKNMSDFHKEVWDKELGTGGLIGDLSRTDRSTIALVVSGDMRRYVPVWENRLYLPPCQSSCPTGIPVHDRWRLVREGRVDEAVDLALAYTPFPATICGYLCPNLCMQGCTKHEGGMLPVDVTVLGKASISPKTPSLPEESGRQIAVIGGGPAGISIAWQLRQKGHRAVVFDTSEQLGGKIVSSIPESRIPQEVLSGELDRVQKIIPHVHLHQAITSGELEKLKVDYDFIVLAIGAQKPRTLNIPGKERLVTALDFLKKAKTDNIEVGKRVVIIGAGNVGCDVATEAHRLGAEHLTLLDIQEPLSFGKERDAAEAAGAQFRWPVFTQEITEEGVVIDGGEIVPADTVVISIGDMPDLDFLPDEVAVEKGFVLVNEHYQSTDPKIFAIGDVVKPGLLTDAIGAGRKAAAAINEILSGKRPLSDSRMMIDKKRVTLEYFDPRIIDFDSMDQCGSQCSSCGSCRDCGICSAICPQSAISRTELEDGDYEYVVDDDRCIGCGFCAQACPCGIWNLIENTPVE